MNNEKGKYFNKEILLEYANKSSHITKGKIKCLFNMFIIISLKHCALECVYMCLGLLYMSVYVCVCCICLYVSVCYVVVSYVVSFCLFCLCIHIHFVWALFKRMPSPVY